MVYASEVNTNRWTNSVKPTRFFLDKHNVSESFPSPQSNGFHQVTQLPVSCKLSEWEFTGALPIVFISNALHTTVPIIHFVSFVETFQRDSS